MVTLRVTTFKDKKIDFAKLAREVNRGRAKPRMTCAKAHLFQGMRDPRCNGGYGCYTCWNKRLRFLDDGVR